MKQIVINTGAVLSVCLVLVLSGCLSVPNSPSPRFYTLQPLDVNQATKKLNIPAEVLIGVGPVKIPEYQARPQMVTRDRENMLKFAQFDRWGESLDLGIARLIGEDLTALLPDARLTSYPWSSSVPVKYQVLVEIVQLDSQLDKDMFLAAQWMISDAQNAKTLVMKRSEFRQPVIPQNYSGLAKTLSAACASLSGEIADSLAALETRPKVKDGAIPAEK